jgi:sterol 24-C-methyltransferase
MSPESAKMGRGMGTTDAVESREGRVPSDLRGAVAVYRRFHDEQAGGTVAARKDGYTTMVSGYYDLVTDLYERGWGESFHFAPRVNGEPFDASIKRHQHYIAARLELAPGMRVLDVGCGVGGPMREIARFSRAQVIGINNNAYQVQKARRFNRERRLDTLCSVLEADFMQIPEPDGSFHAAYGFEATCHAPDKTALFRELFRLLQPGGKIALYEWCLTDAFNSENPTHQAIKKGIETGNGLPDILTIEATRRCFEDAGFALLDCHDRAREGDPEVPWYHSLAGRELSAVGLRRTRLGRMASRGLVLGLEVLRIAPKGTGQIMEFLHTGADALVAGGEAGCFTPMAFFLAQKPAR